MFRRVSTNSKMPFVAGQPIPNVMGNYLEQGAKAVIDMQEELRTQALKLFSGFPYASNEGGEEPRPAAPEEDKPRAKATRKKRK